MQRLAALFNGSVGGVASALPRWLLPALARRDAPLMASVSVNRIHNLHRLFRERNQSMLDMFRFCSSATMHGSDVSAGKKEAEVATRTVTEDIYNMPIMSRSSHRDGSIFNRGLYWENNYCCDIADRTETLLDPMAGFEIPCNMMQIFSLKLAKTPMNSDAIQLYGYIAARDEADYMLNYVFNRSRDDAIILQQGAFIEMTGPKRGIALSCDVLLEFDMRIKNGENEKDDVQLIDGVSEFKGLRMASRPLEVRIGGNYGAVDMSFARVDCAVGAVVEVVISNVQTGFDLSLSSIISLVEVHEVHEEFQLFHGTVSESCVLRRFVIAISLDNMLRLKFKIGHKGSNSNIDREASFQSKQNGYASHQINLELASILVKVTWAAVPV
ncbi:unnamed protein product [Alopecurus aequalis]